VQTSSQPDGSPSRNAVDSGPPQVIPPSDASYPALTDPEWFSRLGRDTGTLTHGQNVALHGLAWRLRP
jgi:hypothetical protein